MGSEKEALRTGGQQLTDCPTSLGACISATFKQGVVEDLGAVAGKACHEEYTFIRPFCRAA